MRYRNAVKKFGLLPDEAQVALLGRLEKECFYPGLMHLTTLFGDESANTFELMRVVIGIDDHFERQDNQGRRFQALKIIPGPFCG